MTPTRRKNRAALLFAELIMATTITDRTDTGQSPH
jgi:hypothetical protein